MDMEPDERLVRYGLTSPATNGKPLEPLLHIRRTLDQSYFLNLKDTSQRDQDQVVYRATQGHGNLTRVVMVDQLWLWVLDERELASVFCVLSPLVWKKLILPCQIPSSHPFQNGGDATNPTRPESTKAFVSDWINPASK